MKATKSLQQHRLFFAGPLLLPPIRSLPSHSCTANTLVPSWVLPIRSSIWNAAAMALKATAAPHCPRHGRSAFSASPRTVLEAAVRHPLELSGVPASRRVAESYLSRPDTSGTRTAGLAAFKLYLTKLLMLSAPHKFNGWQLSAASSASA